MTFTFATVKYASGDWESAPNLPAALIDTLAAYTTIETAPAGVIVDLAGPELLEHPFAWLTGHFPLRLTDAERANLLRYIDRGGFLVIDDHNHDVEGAFHLSAVEEITRTFGPLAPVPNDHEIYRSFFVFEEGPPVTSHEMNGWGDQLIHEELFAIFRNGRIGLLYSNKDYSSEWDMRPETKRFLGSDPTRFGLNLILYALTR